MTEREAIEELKYDCNELGKAIPCDTSWGSSFENAYGMAIQALEKLAEYEDLEKHGRLIMDCQHFFRQIFLGYFSDIVQAFDTLRTNVCGDDYTSLHNPIVLSSVLPAYGMFHSIQILFL